MIEIIEPGPLTSVQDRGRWGHQAQGIGPSGVMDARLAQIANALVSAPGDQAVIEFWGMGPSLEATERPVTLAIAGNAQPSSGHPAWQTLTLHPGERLSIGPLRGHAVGYLAFANPLQVPTWLGSQATHIRAGLGGIDGRCLRPGDRIGLQQTSSGALLTRYVDPERALQSQSASQPIRLVAGPQDQDFEAAALQVLASQPYRLTSLCDRMGYRLEGPALKHKVSADIASDGIAMGSVQVPANGQPIVLLAERQTTGGYTKIATVVSCDLPRLVQKVPGSEVRFSWVSVEEAQAAALADAQALEQLCAQLPLRMDMTTASLLAANLISGVVSGE